MNTERFYLGAWAAAGFALGYRGHGLMMGLLFAVGIPFPVGFLVEFLGEALSPLDREIKIVAGVAGLAALLYALSAPYVSLGSGGAGECTETRFTSTCR